MSYDHWKSTNPDDEWLGPEDGYEMPANEDYADDPPEDDEKDRPEDYPD